MKRCQSVAQNTTEAHTLLSRSHTNGLLKITFYANQNRPTTLYTHDRTIYIYKIYIAQDIRV